MNRFARWSKLLIAGALVCCALALVLLLPLARPGEKSVALAVGPHACSASACAGADCTRTEWIGNDTLRITSTVYVPFTSEVDPAGASVAIDGTTVRLRYFTLQRDLGLGPGDPVPACLMPVALRFDVPGLPKQDYKVVTTGSPRTIERLSLGFAIALLFAAGLLLFAAARRRQAARLDRPAA